MTAAQSVVRALKVLKLIMAAPGEGVRFIDLVKASGMDKSNVHRVLKALEQEGLVFRDVQTAAYHPLVSDHDENRNQVIRDRFKDAVAQLATATGDTVLLMARHGDHVVCLDRQSGDYPVKALTTEIGQKRLMGIGSGGLSILAQLPDEDIGAFLDKHQDELASYAIDSNRLWLEINTCRQEGYASVGDRITPGTGSVGVYIQGPDFSVALCVVSLTDRIGGERTAWLVSEIKRVADSLRVAHDLDDGPVC